MNDSEAAAFYSKPENLRAGERVTPRTRSRMTGHVPIRFPEATIDLIKTFASEDGVTVSTWVRRVIDRAIMQRRAALTATRTVGFSFTLDGPSGAQTIGHLVSASATP